MAKVKVGDTVRTPDGSGVVTCVLTLKSGHVILEVTGRKVKSRIATQAYPASDCEVIDNG